MKRSDITQRRDDMATSDEPVERSGGRRLRLYAEVGKYFLPDGSLNEDAFRQSVTESLERIKRDKGDDFETTAGDWLSAYLKEIIDYLREKGLAGASMKIFRAAIDESSRLGIKKVFLSTDYLGHILSSGDTSHDFKHPKRLSTDEKRSMIFKAALKVFSEQGYHNATIDEIAEYSGVGKGTVYRYFSSKEVLINQLLIEEFQLIVESISSIYSTDSDILQQIRKWIEFWIEFISENHELYRLIQSEAMVKRGEDRVMFYEYLTSHLPMLKERVVALNIEKKLKTTNFYSVFYGILGFIDGVVHKWYRCGRNYDLKEEIPVILEVLFNGFVGENTTKEHFFIPPEEGADF
jgi:AcrR family transcriptional regulator